LGSHLYHAIAKLLVRLVIHSRELFKDQTMQVYISVSYNKRKLLDKEIKTMVNLLADFKIETLLFAEAYKFGATEEHQMMQQAFASIDSSDFLIAETSDKAIGIGVEAGYAKAKGKPVIYVRQKQASHSTTVAGASDFRIIYTDTDDLKNRLTVIIKKILAK
jgi:2'-deoxynucleoside 5'-phosphate N-hydrolase